MNQEWAREDNPLIVKSFDFDVVLNFADAKSEMICHHPIPLSKHWTILKASSPMSRSGLILSKNYSKTKVSFDI